MLKVNRIVSHHYNKCVYVQNSIRIYFSNGFGASILWGNNVGSNCRNRDRVPGIIPEQFDSVHTVEVGILDKTGELNANVLPKYGSIVKFCNMDKLIDILHEIRWLDKDYVVAECNSKLSDDKALEIVKE